MGVAGSATKVLINGRGDARPPTRFGSGGARIWWMVPVVGAKTASYDGW